MNETLVVFPADGIRRQDILRPTPMAFLNLIVQVIFLFRLQFQVEINRIVIRFTGYMKEPTDEDDGEEPSGK